MKKPKIQIIEALGRCAKCGKPATIKARWGFLGLKYMVLCKKHGLEISNKTLKEMGF
jgi:hypothetical protein